MTAKSTSHHLMSSFIAKFQIPGGNSFLCIIVQGRCQPKKSQLIQICSVDWTDVYDTHNIEHRTEPVSH